MAYRFPAARSVGSVKECAPARTTAGPAGVGRARLVLGGAFPFARREPCVDLLGVVQNDPVACLDKGRPSAGGAKNIEERFRQAVALRNLCGPEQPRAIVGLFPTARSFAERGLNRA